MGSIIIGVAGGSGSGKTFFARTLQKKLTDETSRIILQDNYYRDQSDKFDHDGGTVNFDHPDALDFDLLATHLTDLKQNKKVYTPQYDFATHSRKESIEIVEPKKVIIVDGILILSQPKLVELFDLTIYVETPEQIRYDRRLQRDVTERGRTQAGVKAQFESQVKPMHDLFVEPSKFNAQYISSGTDMDLFYQFLDAVEKKLNLSDIEAIELFNQNKANIASCNLSAP